MQESVFTIPLSGQSFPQVQPHVEHDSEAALVNRIEALKMLVVAVLNELDAIRGSSSFDSEVEFDLRNEVHRFEAENIRYALIRTRGRQRRAAKLLNMKVATLNAKIKRYGLDDDELINSAASLR
ncbi:MAG TPA: helix-turn-helix domain-containing protein [Pyrinomonadaceae bacterium]|nr:helix-turn-helix domain-containing protein [Pyrinomonadaceae bacterium]